MFSVVVLFVCLLLFFFFCFFYFCNAFELVDHNLFVQKLNHHRINNLSMSWFEAYLMNITQIININKKQSKAENVIYGMPQGSIISSMLFSFL